MSASDAGRSPRLLRAAWLIASKDLRIEWRTFESLAAMFLFSLVVLVIFNFAFDLATVREVGAAKLVPGVLWITFSFAALIGFTRSFQLEHRRDALVALMQAPVDRGAIFLGKAGANLATVLALEAVLLPLCAVFFDFDLLAVLGPIVLVLLLHTIGLAVLGTLFAAVTSRIRRGEALLATLLLPAATPLFLSAVECTETVLRGEQPLASIGRWLAVAGGLDFLYLLVSLLTFDYIVED